MSVFRRESCRLCGGNELELVLHLEPTPIGDDYVSKERLNEKQETYPMDLYLCMSCGHAQMIDVVDPELLFRNYVYMSSISLGLVEHFRENATRLINTLKLQQNAFVVDIGSNDGSFLKFFKEQGIRVLGIDPAREISKKTTESGIETLPTYFNSRLADKILKEYGRASLVTANNVFAHSDNLSDMTEGIRKLLDNDGVFVFEVSYMLDIIEKKLIETFFHEHLCFHTVKPFNTFFSLCGLQLIDIQRIPTKGGSLRGTVQLSGGPRKVMASVQELIVLEDSIELSRPKPFRKLSNQLERIKEQLTDLLQDLKLQGKTVIGYGASAGVTTMLYYFDLGDKLLFLADDNPRKFNTFSPGHHIPVLPSSTIHERKVDYVLILAWAYAEPIMKKHQTFLDQGGHFIIPLPEVQVI